jgi:hypothetical protein
VTDHIEVVELTWWIPRGSLPTTAEPVIRALRAYDAFLPRRYGPGDPPRLGTGGTDASGFSDYWQSKVADGVGLLHWTGTPPVYDSTLYFGPETVDPEGVARLRTYAGKAGIPVDVAVRVLSEIGESLGCIYGSANVLAGWRVSRGALVSTSGQSQESALPAGTRWLGLPPEPPWLSWLGAAYAKALLRPDSSSDRLIGSSTRYPSEGLVSRHAPFPEKYVARRADPRFASTPPSLPARVIPTPLR